MRFAVVGTGYWAAEIHAAGVAAHAQAELVGVWGRDRGKASDLAARHGGAGFDDFDAMLETVDAVTFAVPPHVQAELAVRAAEAGRHLLLEKPITTDLQAAERLVSAVEQHQVSTVVFFTQRFTPLWEEWLDEVRSAPLLGGQATWLASLRTPGNPYAESVWRKEEGALWDVGPHALSVLLPALGPVAAVTGSRGADDLVHLVLTHESGATSVMSLSLTMPPDAVRIGVELYDEHGWHTRPDDGRQVEQAYEGALSELIGCVEASTTQHRVDVRFGREVVEVLTRCEQALSPRSVPPTG